MARIRTVKPEFFDDEKLASISRDARLTFIGMWVHSDDYGVVKGHHGWLRNQIFPYDDISPDEFDLWLQSLEDIHCIKPFQKNGEQYYLIVNFLKHQKVNRPSDKRNPLPDECSGSIQGIITDDSLNLHGILTDYSVQEGEGEGEGDMERKGRGKGGPDGPTAMIFIPLNGKEKPFPITLEQVKEFQSLFPLVDVHQELKNCRAWNLANPDRRKTSGGVMRHVTAWLTRANPKSPERDPTERPLPPPSPSKRVCSQCGKAGMLENGLCRECFGAVDMPEEFSKALAGVKSMPDADMDESNRVEKLREQAALLRTEEKPWQ